MAYNEKLSDIKAFGKCDVHYTKKSQNSVCPIIISKFKHDPFLTMHLLSVNFE